MSQELPKEIIERVKQPYMAPDSNSFVQNDSPAYIDEMLSENVLRRNGIFKPLAVGKLKEKCKKLSHAHMSFKDNMSFIGILSTQLLNQLYIEEFKGADCPSRESFSVWQDETEQSKSI